jgi:hypothetical protein
LIYGLTQLRSGATLEEKLVSLLKGVLGQLGMEVYSNVLIDGVELDVVAIERARTRPIVHVVEVKSRPKSKLLYQILSRTRLSDYVYAALPARHYLYLKELPEVAGFLVVDIERQTIYEVKKAKYVGNGWRLLELLGVSPSTGNRGQYMSTQTA